MEKIWVPLIGGIVIGAAAAEILRRTRPEKLKELRGKLVYGTAKMCGRIARRTSEAKDSFMGGYRSALQAG